MKTRTQAISASAQQMTRLAIATLVGVVACPVLLSQATLAQTANPVQPLEDFKPNDGGSDPFSNRSGNASSLFDLMHQLTLGNGRSLEDFSSEQQQNLNDAADLFKKQQLMRLKKETPQPTGTMQPLVVPAAPTGTVTP